MYNKLLKQRNSYLKTTNINANSSSEYLNILTNKLVDYGEKIYLSRKKYVDLLNSRIGELYNSICGISDLKLEYISDFKNFDNIKKIYTEFHKGDMIYTGDTTFYYIILKDDIEIKKLPSSTKKRIRISMNCHKQLELYHHILNHIQTSSHFES